MYGKLAFSIPIPLEEFGIPLELEIIMEPEINATLHLVASYETIYLKLTYIVLTSIVVNLTPTVWVFTLGQDSIFGLVESLISL